MNSKTLACTLAIAAFFVAGCAAHSPMILHNTVDATSSGANVTAVPHSRRVLITEKGLPAGAQYQVLETVEVGTIWYGGNEKVDRLMADHARAIGADAVIYVKHWRQPSGFSWAAPHGSGKAVKLSNSAILANIPLGEGNWY
jgi:hypothetical protein